MAEARQLLAEARKSRSTETAADPAPPTWFQQFLTVQSESQKQMRQLLCQLTSSPSPAPSTTSSELTPHRSVVDQSRRPKADAQKPPTLHVGPSLAEFCKWIKAYNDYVEVSQAQDLPQQSQLALLRTFFSMEMREAVEHILLIPDDTELSTDNILNKIKDYVRSQRNIALDCIEFEERKQNAGETFDAFLIVIKTLAHDADLCDACFDRYLVTKIISGIRDKETWMKLLAT